MKLHDSKVFGEVVVLLDEQERIEGNVLAAYSPREIERMRTMSTEEKLTIHRIKKVFGGEIRE